MNVSLLNFGNCNGGWWGRNKIAEFFQSSRCHTCSIHQMLCSGFLSGNWTRGVKSVLVDPSPNRSAVPLFDNTV